MTVMTTNQTIDGVPRELLTQWLAMFEGGIASSPLSALRELTRKYLQTDPAAQPQGGPVAWLAQAVGKGGEVYRNKSSTNEPTMRDIEIAWGQGVIDRFKIVIKPLYAEQPAPVAVVLPERSNAVASANVSAKQAYALGWNACLDEVTRLNTK